MLTSNLIIIWILAVHGAEQAFNTLPYPFVLILFNSDSLGHNPDFNIVKYLSRGSLQTTGMRVSALEYLLSVY